jgi:hypothetical protein
MADSGNRWTVPVGGGIGRVFKVGNQPISSRLEAYYKLVRPDGAPDWQISFTWQFCFPSELSMARLRFVHSLSRNPHVGAAVRWYCTMG